jgi:hypothetical protein
MIAFVCYWLCFVVRARRRLTRCALCCEQQCVLWFATDCACALVRVLVMFGSHPRAPPQWVRVIRASVGMVRVCKCVRRCVPCSWFWGDACGRPWASPWTVSCPTKPSPCSMPTRCCTFCKRCVCWCGPPPPFLHSAPVRPSLPQHLPPPTCTHAGAHAGTRAHITTALPS